MKELFKRSISGVIFVILMLLAIRINQYTLLILLSVLLFTGLNEFYNILRKSGSFPAKITGMVAGFILLLSIFLISSGKLEYRYLYPALLLVFILLFFLLFRKNPGRAVMDADRHTTDKPDLTGDICVNASCPRFSSRGTFLATLYGILYLAIPLSVFTLICFLSGTYDFRLLFGFFIILWTYDSFAYLTGILFGKHRIYPSISPKKSWEGFAGGLIFAVSVSILIAGFFNILSKSEWAIVAVIIVIFGTIGDFFESFLKRRANLKDSGNIIPGHGGILDRFDSVLFSIPAVFLYLSILTYIK